MTDANTIYNEAEKLKDDGRNEEAVAKLNELLAVDPDHLLTHLALAVLHGKLGEHDKAIEHGRRACELDPNDAFNFTALSVTFQRAWQGTQRQEYIQAAEEAMNQVHVLQGQA